MDGSRPPSCDARRKGKDFSVDDQAALRDLVAADHPRHRAVVPPAAGAGNDRDLHHAFLSSDSSASRRTAGSMTQMCPSISDFPKMRWNSCGGRATFIQERFGRAPRGLWPSEGSVSKGWRNWSSRRVSSGWRPMRASSQKSGVALYDGRPPSPLSALSPRTTSRSSSEIEVSPISIGFHYMHGAAARQRAGSPAAAEGNSGRLPCVHHSRWGESLGLLPGQRPRFSAVRF